MPDVTPYDALVVVSFGGPGRPEDVVPFLERVTAGRGIPRERLEEVGQHYHLFGGRSPINDLNRDLCAAIEADLERAGIDLPVYWGNRNWDPYLADALRRMREDGVTRAACFVTSAYSSWSGCRQYRENLHDAVAAVPGAPRLDKLRHYFNHPGFVEPVTDAVLAALAWHRTRPFPVVPIFGATTAGQLERILGGIEASVPPDLARRIDEVHKAHPMPY